MQLQRDFRDKQNIQNAKPVLKWAGGKTQLLNHLLPKIPNEYGKYIEPFFGGGALFFALQPEQSVIADSNPEIINLYYQIANNPDAIIKHLIQFNNTEKDFYEIRSWVWQTLSKDLAAARTIFLNKTCFNGLYRVNKSGQFNAPYGNYTNPKICDSDALWAASALLKKAEILCGDYLDVLKMQAKENDVVFLDPPYLPISEYADFKRYTKEQFYKDDHLDLANEVARLSDIGCHVILTNSNHPLVHELYGKYPIEVVATKRHISCNGGSRKGEDVIVKVAPKIRRIIKIVPDKLPEQVKLYPSTRFMGSKNKLLQEIWSLASRFEFDSVIDLFSGSGIVGYMFKSNGKRIISNDYLKMSSTFTKALIENNTTILPLDEAVRMLENKVGSDDFVSNTFKGLYFTDEENQLIDSLRSQIHLLRDSYKRAIAMSALIRACMKKRPRGIFTYTGLRYDDGRLDLRKTINEHFIDAVDVINNAVFDNGKRNKSRFGDAMTYRGEKPDLVYIDPPYYSPLSDNEYVRRYHFVEGLARDWVGVEIQNHTQTKKFKSYPTPFSTRDGAADALDKLFRKFVSSIIIVSYSSNSFPTMDEMLALLAKHKQHVEVAPIDYRYSFGNQGTKVNDNKNEVKEYLFVGY